MCVYIFRTGGSHAQSPPRHQVTNHPTHLPGTPRSSVDTCRFSRLGRTRRRGKALQRLVASNDLRRIGRGLYDLPRVIALTGQTVAPDYRQVIDAVSRRDQVRVMIDDITAANDLGLTHAVPGQVVVHTDGRLRPIQLGQMTLKFKLTDPSKLYWAGRPAMRVVQSLHWQKDSLKQASSPDQEMVMKNLCSSCNPRSMAIRSPKICNKGCMPCPHGCRPGFATCWRAQQRLLSGLTYESRFSANHCRASQRQT